MADAKHPQVMPADGQTLIRSQDSMIQRIAVQNPRDEDRILGQCVTEIERQPQVADQNVYSIPFKKHQQGCRDRRNCDCPVEYVEGLSVRAAENIARRWGNCDVQSGVVEVGDDYAIVEGVFLDFETMARRTERRRISRYESRRDGKTYLLNASNWETKIAKEASIAGRNAALKAIPSWIRQEVFDRCLQIVADRAKVEADSKKEQPWQGIEAWFRKKGVDRKRLERFMNKTLPKLSDEEIARLRVTAKQIQDGEKTVQEIFGPESDGGGPGASVDDVLNSETTAEQEPVRTDEAKTHPMVQESITKRSEMFVNVDAAALEIRKAVYEKFGDLSALSGQSIAKAMTFAQNQSPDPKITGGLKESKNA